MGKEQKEVRLISRGCFYATIASSINYCTYSGVTSPPVSSIQNKLQYSWASLLLLPGTRYQVLYSATAGK